MNWDLWNVFIIIYDILMIIWGFAAIISFFLALNEKSVKLNIVICMACSILIIGTSIFYLTGPFILQAI